MLAGRWFPKDSLKVADVKTKYKKSAMCHPSPTLALYTKTEDTTVMHIALCCCKLNSRAG